MRKIANYINKGVISIAITGLTSFGFGGTALAGSMNGDNNWNWQSGCSTNWSWNNSPWQNMCHPMHKHHKHAKHHKHHRHHKHHHLVIVSNFNFKPRHHHKSSCNICTCNSCGSPCSSFSSFSSIRHFTPIRHFVPQTHFISSDVGFTPLHHFSNSTTITNTNNVDISNTSSQTAISGNAYVVGNTFGGNATSGNASNYNSTNISVAINN